MNAHREKYPAAGPRRRRMPLWLRLLLMALLVLAAAVAFYFNNLNIIERLENR